MAPYLTIYLILDISTKKLEANLAEHQFTHKFKKTGLAVLLQTNWNRQVVKLK